MSKIYLRFPNFKLKAFTMSYDDGVRQDKKLIEIMRKNGLKGTFNINSGLFSEKYAPNEQWGVMSLKEAVELYKGDDIEIAVHGYKHYSLPYFSSEQAVYDVIEDRKNLEKIFGKIIKGMAYAFGTYNEQVIEILKQCGIKYSRTVEATKDFLIGDNWLALRPTCRHKDPDLMQLAERFVNVKKSTNHWDNKPMLFYLWGHSYEFDVDNNWQVIEDFAKYISNREDVWYATNGEIYDYVKAVDNLEISVDGTIIYNPSLIKVYIEYFGKQIEINPGETIKI